MECKEYERRVLGELRGLLFGSDGRTRRHTVDALGYRVEVEEMRFGTSCSEGACEGVFLYRGLWRRSRTLAPALTRP